MSKQRCPAQRQGKKGFEKTQVKYAPISQDAQPCPMAYPVCAWCGYIKEVSLASGRRRVFCELTGEKLARLAHE